MKKSSHKTLKKRIIYGLIILSIIISGLASRKVSFIPLATGDLLWASMIYFILRFIFIERTLKESILLGLAICYSVEFSQLIQTPWLVSIRGTTLGHLVLGQGFLWSDLVAYGIGILLSVISEMIVQRKMGYK